MGRFRYSLLWLLLLPVLLAVAVWGFKPPAHASYDYLADQDPQKLRAPGFYHVKPVYLDRQLLLDEIQECDYAILYVAADWSPYTEVTIRQLHAVSSHYQGRIPIFVCRYEKEEYLDWFPGMSFNYKFSESTLCLVQRGVITDQIHDFWSTTESLQATLNRLLPWNYRL